MSVGDTVFVRFQPKQFMPIDVDFPVDADYVVIFP